MCSTERVRAAKPAKYMQEELANGNMATIRRALRVFARDQSWLSDSNTAPRLLRFRLSSAEPADKRATRKSAD